MSVLDRETEMYLVDYMYRSGGFGINTGYLYHEGFASLDGNSHD